MAGHPHAGRAGDDEAGFEAGAGLVGELHHRFRGLRIGRTGAVIEALVPSILEQKVVGLEARRSWARLVRALGDPAPGPERLPGRGGGPAALFVPPPATVLASTPTWVFHRANVERKRADTIRRACSYAARLEETVGMAPDDARMLELLEPWRGHRGWSRTSPTTRATSTCRWS